MNRFSTKIGLFSSAVALSALSLVGCRGDVDLAVGVGHGGSSAYDPWYPGYSPGYGPGYFPGQYPGQYPGGAYYPYPSGPHYPGHHHGGWKTPDEVTRTNQVAQDFAKAFGLPVSKSKQLKASFDSAAVGNANALGSIGLTVDDAKALANGHGLSQASVQRVAQTMQQNPSDTVAMLNYLTSETQNQTKNPASPLWQKCMQAGTWRTPQNDFCQESFWQGCGVDSGASFCVPGN